MSGTRSAARRLEGAAIALAQAARAASVTPDVPYRNISSEGRIFELPEFRAVAEALTRSVRVRRMYGTDGRRIALTWVYRSVADPRALPEVWRSYWADLMDPRWVYVSVANLTNYRSSLPTFDFADGVQVRERGRRDLSELLGWDESELERTIGADWMSHGTSEHVLVAVTSVPKSPENLVLSGPGTDYILMARALMALRLVADGDIGIGTTYTTRRKGGIDVLLGMSSTPPPLAFGYGTTFLGTETVLAQARTNYLRLGRLEARPAKQFLELRSALDRFRAAYGRGLAAQADRIVDDVIALESVSAVTDELAYTISVRVSGLLADSDAERVELFNLLKSFYRVRSTIVHGGTLKEAAFDLLAREPELRQIVRSLLRGLLFMTDDPVLAPTREFLSRTIDEYVLDSGKRVRLRVAMGTEGWTAASPKVAGSETFRMWADDPPSSAVLSGGVVQT